MPDNEVLIEITDLNYKPLGVDEPVLKGISAKINKGDFVLLLGRSGCGKTILTRCLNGLIPHLDLGEMQGSVVVKQKDTRTYAVHEFSGEIGMVFQNPDDQILSLKVVDEVAWGVENTGFEHEEIVERVDHFMKLLGIEDLKHRLTFAISGGQKQKVSIASNLAMLQDILVLDDPTTDLDPVCTADVIETLANIHRDMGKTLIVIEHDLEDLIELANRIILMEDGKILYDGPTAEVISHHYDSLLDLGMNMPQHVEIAHAIQPEPEHGHMSIYKEETFQMLEGFFQESEKWEYSPPPAPPIGDAVMEVEGLNFSYSPNEPVLTNLDFQIYSGEFIAIIGANGSGKSTLVKNLIGLMKPSSGKVIINGHDTQETDVSDLVSEIGYVFQDPDQQLFANNVFEEIVFGLRARGQLSEENERHAIEVLRIVGLDHLQDRHPFSLSRGQRQKLAVASALLHNPKIVILDEPTTGQDRRSLSGLLNLLNDLNCQGNTTIMVTHNMDIVTTYATRVLVMEDGRIVMDGPSEEVFYEHFDSLEFLNLRPPTVIDYCRRLESRGMPRFMTADALISCIKEVRKGQMN